VQLAQISQYVLLEPPALSHPSCAAVPQPSTESHIQQPDAHAQRTGEAMCMKQLERDHSLAVHAQSLGGVAQIPDRSFPDHCLRPSTRQYLTVARREKQTARNKTALHPQARGIAAASSATHHKHVCALWATCTAVLASSCISTARCAACSLPRQCVTVCHTVHERSHSHGATQPLSHNCALQRPGRREVH